MTAREQQYYRILLRIQKSKSITQRSLSKELGIAVGLTNLLIGRLVKRGLVKITRNVQGRRLRYLLTPKGVAEQSRLSAVYLENTISLYTETRDRIKKRLDEIAFSDSLPCKRIIFYGAGEVAEIAYITLAHSKCKLAGVVDDHKQGQTFFGHMIGPPEELVNGERDKQWDTVFVTALREAGKIRQKLIQLNVPENRIALL